jgi:hypothetical protein
MDGLFEQPEVSNLLFSDDSKAIIASTIYVACGMSKNVCDDMINMPNRASWLAGLSLPFFIERLLANQIDQNQIGKFPFYYREVKSPKSAFSYIEYYSDTVKFHIKKVRKVEKLPTSANHRTSNAKVNQLFLGFGPEFVPQGVNVPFGIITYDHFKFDLKFICLGFPKYDYTDWQNPHLSIMEYISKEMSEYIKKENDLALKEEYKEKVEKILPKLKDA